MAYVIKRRQTKGYVAKMPYAGIDFRYVYEIAEAQKYSRYVDAFNDCRANEMVLEI